MTSLLCFFEISNVSTSLLSLTELLFAMEDNKSLPVEHVSRSVKSVSSSKCAVSSNDSDIDVEVEKDLQLSLVKALVLESSTVFLVAVEKLIELSESSPERSFWIHLTFASLKGNELGEAGPIVIDPGRVQLSESVKLSYSSELSSEEVLPSASGVD